MTRERPVMTRERPVIARREALAGLGALLAAPALGMPAVRRLRWTGAARVTADGRELALGVRALVEPFASARLETWGLREGPPSRRVLAVERGGAWVSRGGTWDALPVHQAAHERAQFAIHGLMLMRPPTRVRRLDGGRVRVTAPGAPDTLFGLDADGLPAWAENRVPGADGRGEVALRFTFAGRLESNGVRWPSAIEIARDGEPYLLLALNGFAAEA